MKNLGTVLTIVCLTLCLYLVEQAGADSSLVLYFDFESESGNIVEDRSIYGNDGDVNGVAKWVDGIFGKGLELDRDSFVLVPDCDEFKITDELTIACWAKCIAFAPGTWEGNTFDFMVCRWNHAQGDNRCYEMYLRSRVPAITISSDGTGGGSSRADAEEPVELDQWYSFVGVFDGSKVRIYVDGKERGSMDHEGNILAGEGPITIGDNDFGIVSNFHFVGVIDEVAVYNRALNQSEIEKKMAQGHIAAAVKSEGKLATTWGDIKIQP